MPNAQGDQLQTEYDLVKRELAELKSEEEHIDRVVMQAIATLLQTSMAEVSSLNKLLVPLISLMRTEVELPFNSEHFGKFLEK